MSDRGNALRRAAEWLAAGEPVALATVVETFGASPRPVGSVMTVGTDGAFEGSVSGGCVEATVITEARDVLAGGAPRLLEFGVADETAWEVGLACGGQLRVWLEAVREPALLTRLSDGAAVGRVVRLADGASAILDSQTLSSDVASGAVAEARSAFDKGRGGPLSGAGEGHCLLVYPPLARMLVIGAVHIAQVLVPMAAAAGFDVTVIDPRRVFATPDRFAGAALDLRWPDEALEALRPDDATAVVALTHDPKLDDPGLAAALRSPAFYVGALGSRRSHAARRERLAALGFTEAELDRIHGPVGLDIGGRGAGEIAVSIAAQVVAARHGRPTRP